MKICVLRMFTRPPPIFFVYAPPAPHFKLLQNIPARGLAASLLLSHGIYPLIKPRHLRELIVV